MALSMQHWNGDQMCVIDTETTGLEWDWHEIIQICILPLDSNLNVREDVNPFYVNIIPEHPERADSKAMRVNRLSFAKIAQNGFHPHVAKDMLEQWVQTLDLPYTKYGNRKRIIPLGQNYAFDLGFIRQWLGLECYEEMFHFNFRDTKRAALYLNDRAGMHVEKIPYPKTGLAWLAKTFKIEHKHAHDALADCLTTAKVYKKLISKGLLG